MDALKGDYMQKSNLSKLTDLKNIGKLSEFKLKEIGITSPEQLIKMGSKEVFLLLRKVDKIVSLDMLYGLQGAIDNTKWCDLPVDIKNDLKLFYNSLNKK